MAPLWFQSAFTLVAVVTTHASQLTGGNAQKPVIGTNSTSKNPLNDDFAKYVQDSLDFWHVPGMSIGVVDKDQVYTEGYGYATLPDVHATADTLWYGCSTTKSQAAALLSHLINSGNYSSVFPRGWETPLSSIIRDDFVLQDEWATAHVTLNDAVSHRSGLGQNDYAILRVRDGKRQLPRDLTRNMRNLNMILEPRVGWSYCNWMYIALGHVLESVTGNWLGQTLRETLWAPLGMDSTYFDLDDALSAPGRHLATGYAWNRAAENYTPLEYVGVTEISAAGAVISSVNDYVKWVKCLMHKSAPLSEKTHADIQKPRMYASNDENGEGAVRDEMATSLYSLGWMRTTIHRQTVFYHPGSLHAYGAEVFWLPEINYGAVAFGNTATSSNWQQLDVIYRLIEDRLEIPTDERFDIRALSRKTLENLLTREKAIEAFFPDRPEHPLPSSFNTSQLAGSYTSSGWGDVRFAESQDEQDGGRIVALVGPRPQATFQHTITLEHVTGDNWLVKIALFGNSPLSTVFYTARFVAGVNGKPDKMELETGHDGLVVFKRME